MTTYATSTTQQAPPLGGPPAPPPQKAGGPPTRRTPRPRPAGLVAAATAFVVAAGATVATAAALATPVTPAQQTVNVVAPPPVSFNASEVASAKSTACSAWEQAARSTALASKASAQALEQSWSNPESIEALAQEKRTGMAAVSYLRSQMDSATPASTEQPLSEWIDARIDMLHALNMRNWDQADRDQQRGNDLIGVIRTECGLR
jgi:hypothetical protein